MMNLIIVVAAAVGLLLLLTFAALFRKLSSEDQSLPLNDDWGEPFSEGRYRAMGRLLDREDLAYLAAQPGMSRSRLRRFRAQRRRIFRGYLACLSRDYGQVSSAIKVVMLHASRDRGDLAAFLVRQRLRFTLGLMAAEFRLTLHSLGVGRVEVRRLVEALDILHLELHHLVQAIEPAAA